ncbi:DUF732 domain-containing protein [Rhodococcus sp. X156]|uniref:DUF732 domain-containing protein n=1 Tax=Rhodococcus sp. X156 TaxID=2499145 RepID=UPI000FDB0EE3|nr:DUF732 domain-containing protein [Rhodococcus sp. X156]
MPVNTRITGAVVALAATAGLGATGCGADGSSPVTTPSPPPATTPPATTPPAASPSGTSPPLAAPPPGTTVYVVPTGSTYTEYVPYPSYPGYGGYPTYGSSYSDADFLARMRARDIVTPDDAVQVVGARGVCQGLSQGSGLTAAANELMDPPYDYSAVLAGYFAGEAVRVYCPQYTYLLTP